MSDTKLTNSSFPAKEGWGWVADVLAVVFFVAVSVMYFPAVGVDPVKAAELSSAVHAETDNYIVFAGLKNLNRFAGQGFTELEGQP